MESIVLIMRRKPVATALRQRIQDNARDLDLVISCVYEYDQAPDLVRQDEGTAALIEVAEYGMFNLSYCLKLCAVLRETTSRCRILLLCPEEEEDIVAAALKAKQDQLIDDYIFYDATLDYMASKILTL